MSRKDKGSGKCVHANVTVTEHFRGWGEYEFDSGKVRDDGWSDSMPNGQWSADCRDCGFSRTYYKRIPAWLKPLIEQIKNHAWREG
jgi:hypothetical protein